MRRSAMSRRRCGFFILFLLILYHLCIVFVLFLFCFYSVFMLFYAVFAKNDFDLQGGAGGGGGEGGCDFVTFSIILSPFPSIFSIILSLFPSLSAERSAAEAAEREAVELERARQLAKEQREKEAKGKEEEEERERQRTAAASAQKKEESVKKRERARIMREREGKGGTLLISVGHVSLVGDDIGAYVPFLKLNLDNMHGTGPVFEGQHRAIVVRSARASFVYTCRRLIDLSLSLYIHAGD